MVARKKKFLSLKPGRKQYSPSYSHSRHCQEEMRRDGVGVRFWRDKVYRIFKGLHGFHQAFVHTYINPIPNLQKSDSWSQIPGPEGERNLLGGRC